PRALGLVMGRRRPAHALLHLAGDPREPLKLFVNHRFRVHGLDGGIRIWRKPEWVLQGFSRYTSKLHQGPSGTPSRCPNGMSVTGTGLARSTNCGRVAPSGRTPAKR